MKAVFRLYLNTSKGSDPFLYRELLALKTRPQYDEHLHAFYLDAPLRTLLHLSFHSFIAENMWVQIGKPFPAINELTFPQHLEDIQFKNYLPLRRGLIENMTLSILIRQTQYPLSDRLITTLLQTVLEKEITKREYHQNVLKAAGASSKDSKLPYSELKEIVQRKWEQEDIVREGNYLKLLTNQSQSQQALLNNSKQLVNIQQQPHQQTLPANVQEAISYELASQLPFHPQLTFYVRKNQGRLLLKINKQEMYKHGWKKQVGWAPIRETLVAAILSHTRLLQQQSPIRLWDPFCGSATIPIVAAAQYYSLKVRGNPEQNFNWPHWGIFKPQFLEEYLREEQVTNQQKIGKLKLICSDISFQAINYTINNLKELDKSMPLSSTVKQQAVRRLKPTDQIFQMREGEWAVICGDFEQIASNVLFGEEKVNIITNLPYTQSRSKEVIPLNQLKSIYRRFNKMIDKHKDKIANVFVIINSTPSEIASPNHFLSISSEKWQQIATFQSGGIPVGLFAWSKNTIKAQFFDTEAVKNEILLKKNQIESIDDDSKIQAELIKYREKIRQIEKKNYFLPKHLLKFKKGFRRVLQKRRRRHLLRAYEIFARQRDKMIAFAEYSKKKLEVAMLRRGYIWRKRNMRLLQGFSIQEMEAQLKSQFESRIQEALVKSEADQKYKQEKRNKIKQETEQQKEAKKKMLQKKYWARRGPADASKIKGKVQEKGRSQSKKKAIHRKK